MTSNSIESRLALASIRGTALFVAGALLMHVVQPELDPVDVAVSYYLNGAYGWVLGATLVAFGLGSLALAYAMQRMDRAGMGVWALAAWGAGAVVGGLFPPDPMGHWDQPPSFAGAAHMFAAMVAFLTFPIAALNLSTRIGRLAGDSTRGARLRWLARGAAVTLLVFMVCLSPAFANQPPRFVGLVERILLIFHAVWLTTASRGVYVAGAHSHRRSASRASPSAPMN